ncbi:aminopeptidase P family protein [Porphyromonadaceae bacterium]
MKNNSTIQERLQAFRLEMKACNLSAFIVPTTDPHGSEYLTDYWKCREWLSGFTGSVGTLVVTSDRAALWVDSRYHIQADVQLGGTGIEVMKVAVLDYADIAKWIAATLPENSEVGIDASLSTERDAVFLQTELAKKRISLSLNCDPIQYIWEERPSLPLQPPFVYSEQYAGMSVEKKLDLLIEKLEEFDAEAIMLTALDEIAWLLNIRGSDIECNPVVMCYAYISKQRSILFIDERKVTDELRTYFKQIGISLQLYSQVYSFLETLQAGTSLMIDRSKVNYKIIQSIPSSSLIISHTSPVLMMKAVKNEVEIEGIRNAMIKDGIALLQFWRWLENNIGNSSYTEADIAREIKKYKEKQEYYIGESFDTIVGYQSNGAIVHYHAQEGACATIRPEGLLLIDCGSQYLDGTTDITRTYALSELDAEQKRDYTLVLKGHIALSMCKFPKGTRGAQIDVLARQAMWKSGINYLHGTGHGVGHFLNVHEGPQSIRMNENPVMLEPGMLISNEPGIYREGKYGIRIENLILVRNEMETSFGSFYGFETMTLFPYDLNAIDITMLNEEEKEWIDLYHQRVFEALSPYLTQEEQMWLKAKTNLLR